MEQHQTNYVLYISQELTVCQKCIELFLFWSLYIFLGNLLCIQSQGNVDVKKSRQKFISLKRYSYIYVAIKLFN